MRHLIVFCHLRWDFVHQRPQHLLTRLARYFHITLVEEPVFSEGPPRLSITEPVPNLEVLRPLTPHQGAGFADDQMETLTELLSQHLKQRKVKDCVAWFYTPMALPLLQALRPIAVVYDCMDELSAFKNAPAQLTQREDELMLCADVVFTGGPSLYEAKRPRHENVLCLPSAVDAVHYAPRHARADADAMCQAQRLQGHIPHPRLGFFGVIDERLDLQLIEHVARARPEWQLVLVGPVVKISPDDLPRGPNIHWLGQQPYSLLPQLVAGWDVCLLPFALNESTRFISPTKTLEYMAAEKPVVSTPVRDVRVLYGKEVFIANGADVFVEACGNALSETPGQRLRRNSRMRATVARYSWDNTADTMRRAIEQATSTDAPSNSLLQAA
jgi:glycosyltransferase involved in cell wall biosynthesis